jgi:RNA ligase
MEKILVLMMGPQGSGKTSWCRENLPDFFRISQDDQGLRQHFELFEEAIRRGEPHIVVDRTNGPKYQRKRYLDLGRQNGYRTRIVWLNVDRNECLLRCRERGEHPTLEPEKAERAIAIFFRSLQYPTRQEADETQIIGPQPEYVPVRDLRVEIGERRHLIVGDIHGCLDELLTLLARLDFDPALDSIISVGDIVDRGPRIKETVEYLFGLPSFHMVLGNHEDKFLRYLHGHSVQIGNGLENTIASFGDRFPPDLAERLETLPLILRTPSGYVVHAGFNPESLPEEQRREDCIYMRFHGGKTYFDATNGVVWHALWPKDSPRVFFGHIPTTDGPFEPHVVGLDGGCVFGGELRIFDSRDGQIHVQNAHRAYSINEYAREAIHIAAPEQVRKREEYVAQGLLRSDHSDDGRLAVYTYTDACAFANAWDEFTRNSRGHIYHVETGECVAWAFPKFFNLGENAESQPEKFPWEGPYEVMEKLDGWLGVLYRDEGKFKVSTRGSFHSSGSVWATQAIRDLDFGCLPEDATLCFEILTPEQRIILDYGDERKLVILAGFNRFTGEEYPRDEVENWARQIGLPMVPLLEPMSLEELKIRQRELEKVEGFVIRFPDGRRVKVKTDWYLGLARIMANLTPIGVWESLSGGMVPESYLMKIPEELRGLAEKYRDTLESQYRRVQDRIEQIVRPILERFGSNRASLGRFVQEHTTELGPLRSALFPLLDGKADKLDVLVKEMIYPHSNHFIDDATVFPPSTIEKRDPPEGVHQASQ